MNAALVDEVLRKLAAGQAGDKELLDCAHWAMADGANLAHLRAGWPTDELPIIESYYSVARLGEGASGVVFKALALTGELGFVALKLLQFHVGGADRRFREREIEILKSLNCPHVARYLASGVSGGTMYLAMELVEGQTLDKHLAQHTGSLKDKLALFRLVCDVVAGLHAQGVIHRDLKPKHVLVDRDGQPWVVDFGLSAVQSEDWPTRVRRAQTELGNILGTVKYMSPEQAWGGLIPVDHRTDIWSLGIMLYEIATDGDYPYDLDPVDGMVGHDALLHRIQTEVPKAPRIAEPGYADALGTLISRCLAHEPKRRIDSAETLALDVSRSLVREAIHTRRLPLWYRLQRIAIGLAARRRGGLWAAVVCGVLVFLFAVAAIFGVRWEVSGEDYGRDTRRSLATAGGDSDAKIIVVGITDQSIPVVPELAGRMHIEGVNPDTRSWRAVHGWLMERLAEAKPRAVLWDLFFRTRQSGDAGFVRGAEALRRADVPLALAVQRYQENGQPELSADLFEPLANSVAHGLILARDMVAREGEFVLALRRGNEVYSALVLDAFAAIAQPKCLAAIDWNDVNKELRLVYYPRSGTVATPAVDRIGLTSVFEVVRPLPGALLGDILGCKAFTLHRPEWWADRTIAYEELLTLDSAELARTVRGAVVIFGDLRSSTWVSQADRHRVRYGVELIDDVPGVYLIADAVNGLLTNRYLAAARAPTSSLSRLAFGGAALCALLACLLPRRLTARRWPASPAGRTAVVLALLALALICTVVMVMVHDWYAVHAAVLGAAACFAMAASFAIEFVRNRYRMPVSDGWAGHG